MLPRRNTRIPNHLILTVTPIMTLPATKLRTTTYILIPLPRPPLLRIILYKCHKPLQVLTFFFLFEVDGSVTYLICLCTHPTHPHEDLSHGLSALDLHLFATPGVPLTPLPNTYSTSSPHVVPSDLSMMHFHQQYYDSISALPSQPVSPTAPQTPSHKPSLSLQNRDQYILYFFRQIRQIHFLYSGPNVESVLRDLIVREPNGVVATSICAVAALHQSIIRSAEGLEDPSADNSQNAISKQFHEHTWWLLQQSRQRMGRYTEQDATAAIHLVTYSLLSDGSGDWQVPLNVALEWLVETPLNTSQNPRLQWLQQSLSARFTAQMTMVRSFFSPAVSFNPGRGNKK